VAVLCVIRLKESVVTLCDLFPNFEKATVFNINITYMHTHKQDWT